MSKLVKGDYVLATKYSDGDPNDHWVVGFFHGMLPKSSGDRFEVVDSGGAFFRGNGFRRIKKISAERGNWLLTRAPLITASQRSLWSWVREPMNNNESRGES